MPDQLPPEPPEDGFPRTLGVILCGGRGSRLGGADKASLTHRGRTFLDLSVEALSDCGIVVAVGEERPSGRQLVWTTEEPAFGGPAAGLLAGVRAGTLAGIQRSLPPPAWVVALAVDMPLVTADTVRRLWAAAGTDQGEDGALLVDRAGRRQYLCAVYRIPALLQNAPEETSGLPVHRLLTGLRLAEVEASGPESSDVDEPTDVDSLDRP